MAHTFNPSTWESRAFNPSTRKVEMGMDSAGQRKNVRRKETRAQMGSEDSLKKQSADAV